MGLAISTNAVSKKQQSNSALPAILEATIARLASAARLNGPPQIDGLREVPMPPPYRSASPGAPFSPVERTAYIDLHLRHFYLRVSTGDGAEHWYGPLPYESE